MEIISHLLKAIFRLRNRSLMFGRRVKLEPALLCGGGTIEIGDNSCVRFGSVLMPAGGRIRIGSDTSVNHYCILHGGNGLDIGNNCLIAPRVSMFASNHEFHDGKRLIREQGMSNSGGIKVGNDVWIGTGAVIVDGIVIEDGAVIGAGSVVTKSVLSGQVVAGNPAKAIGERR